jgi:hypothetical protein
MIPSTKVASVKRLAPGSIYALEFELKLLGNVAAVEIACSASSDKCVFRWNDVNFVSSGINSPPVRR